MTDQPKEPKTVSNAYHGEGDADAGVVTESVTGDRKADEPKPSDEKRSEDVETGSTGS